ncbi:MULTISPECIES: adenine-specific methyltransferase EcoRI family protein [unclassified Variovorax]|uniref:adenine-specific methyltransferase EcoRI family protein n=1 Tax=unclassified Variovorax TaxID=663243 RepID=UPI0013190574|nr:MULTISPECIES: adenine-specific methyltransferase EcoRI family protein [unclassified Variovorax]VTU41823.1 hypothetical protein H6P1_00053 [Variovorax sp. PBL-H6]VTU44506.1 hypothetical protein SRS16P1_00849 [Variovorax sp. SRS16]VTU44552.1 hypothetical protein E5P1_00842 [Variovorax sp. PBL-E5]
MASASAIRATSANNNSLAAAKRAKNDEFYTQLSDIEKELRQYKDHFKDKVVFCNCDDPEWSSFWKYFTLNFTHLRLAKVVATHYARGEVSYKREYTGGSDMAGVRTSLEGDGDFRSAECIELLCEADIVVTNPPFSLFREYVAQLIEHQKKFVIIGNNNAITYKDIFRLLRDGQLWLGHSANKTMEFKLSADYEKWDRLDEAGNKFGKVPAISWFTNLPHEKRNEEIILVKEYRGHEYAYPSYANYDAIEVSQVKDLPKDYSGDMGVPITFLDKHSPHQFEIIGLGIASSGLEIGVKPYLAEHKAYRKTVQQRGAVDGDLYMLRESEVVVPYARIIIRSKTL